MQLIRFISRCFIVIIELSANNATTGPPANATVQKTATTTKKNKKKHCDNDDVDDGTLIVLYETIHLLWLDEVIQNWIIATFYPTVPTNLMLKNLDYYEMACT